MRHMESRLETADHFTKIRLNFMIMKLRDDMEQREQPSQEYEDMCLQYR